ncbi:MAG: hypothetical protein KC583_14185, partial [Myxococcales bacterium]|nr:hypothetical protein [Myxococcales bacterium]
KNLALITRRDEQRLLREGVASIEYAFHVETGATAPPPGVVEGVAPSPLATGLVTRLAAEAAALGVISGGRAVEIARFR